MSKPTIYLFQFIFVFRLYIYVLRNPGDLRLTLSSHYGPGTAVLPVLNLLLIIPATTRNDAFVSPEIHISPEQGPSVMIQLVPRALFNLIFVRRGAAYLPATRAREQE